MKPLLILLSVIFVFVTNITQAQQSAPDTKKLPLKIVKSTTSDTLTIMFSYNAAGQMKHIDIRSSQKDNASADLVYSKDKLVCNYKSANSADNKTITYSMQGNLITKNEHSTFKYSNGRLDMVQSPGSIWSSYKLEFDENGNVAKLYREIPPFSEDDEISYQTYWYSYNTNLKNRFFFTTCWFICDLPLCESDNYYELPTLPFYGVNNTNMVSQVISGNEETYKYKYYTFSSEGYPLHYAVFDSGDSLIADYRIFYNDYVSLNNKNGKWGLVDFKGNEVVPAQYDSIIYDYSSGYSSVENANKWGCIRNNGDIVLPAEYDRPVPFSDSMLVVIDGKWHWIDKNKNELVKFNFDADASGIDMLGYNKYSRCIELNNGINYSLLRNKIEIPSSLPYELINKGDVRLLKFCLANLDADTKGSLLSTSIDQKKYDIFNLILEFKPTLDYESNRYDDNIFTTLTKQLCENQLSKEVFKSVLSEYLNAGANPNVLEWSGTTPLIYYIFRINPQDTEIIETFLKGGAKVNFKDKNNKTAINYAKESPDNVKEILKKHAKEE
jgi:hypothetical protein